MKKLWMLMTVLVLALGMTKTAYAAGAELNVSSVSAQCTQTVYLTVSLENCQKANSIGLSMEYDSKVLKRIDSGCKWEMKGALQDFDVVKDTGVWAAKKAENINGDICTLAFRVKADAPIGDTKVTCKVSVKNDSKVVGTYTAVGTVSVGCEHSYNGCEQVDEDIHKEVCIYCSSERTTKHIWDEGELIQKPTEQEVGEKVFTCKDCGVTKSEVVDKLDGSQDEPMESNKPDDSIESDLQIKPVQPENQNKWEDIIRPGQSANHDKWGEIVKPGQSANQDKWEDIIRPGQFDEHDNWEEIEKQEESGKPFRDNFTDQMDASDTTNQHEHENSQSVEVEKPENNDDNDEFLGEVEQEHTHNHSEEGGQLTQESAEDNSTAIYLVICLVVVVSGLLLIVIKKIKKDRK